MWLPFLVFRTSSTTRLYFSVPRTLFWPPPTLHTYTIHRYKGGREDLMVGCCFDTPRRLVCFGCFFLFVYSTTHHALPTWRFRSPSVSWTLTRRKNALCPPRTSLHFAQTSTDLLRRPPLIFTLLLVIHLIFHSTSAVSSEIQ